MASQTTTTHIDKLLVRKARKTTAEEEESTASKRQRKEKKPNEELPSLFMEGDSTQNSKPSHISLSFHPLTPTHHNQEGM